jgi:hypothetical protein
MKYDKEKGSRLIKLYEDSCGKDVSWRNHWEEVTKYVQPSKSEIWTSQHVKGEEKHFQLFDGSAEHYNEIHASALHSRLTSPASFWWALTSGKPQIDRINNVRRFFEEVQEIGHSIINASNFHSEIHEMFLDLGGMGSSVLFMEEDEEEIVRYECHPIYKFTAWENNKKLLNSVAWKEPMTVRQALMEYSLDAFHPDCRNKITKDLDKEIEIVRVIMPREETKMRGLGSEAMPFASYHVYKDGKYCIRESGYREMPVMIPRYTKISGEKYGRSPGMKSLPDIRMLNEEAKLTIQGAQKQIDPPTLIVEDSVIGALDLTPGGASVVRNGIQNPVMPFMLQSNPQIGLEMMNETRTRIKENFLVDKLQLREGDRMTTVEVEVRTDDSLQLFSPILGRFNYEFLQAHTARLLGIMERKGLMPKVPNELNGISSKVRFTSQIAKALRINEAVNTQRFINAIAPAIQVDQTAMDNINIDEYVRANADWYGVPARLLTTEEERDEIRQERQAMAEKAQEQQEAVQQSEVARNAAPLIQAQQ